VVAAAVVLDPARHIQGLADSKKLTPARREALHGEIRARALAWALGRAEVAEIDCINILQASLLAMRRALEALPIRVDHALVDGNRIPDGLYCSAEAVVGGDGSEPCISAASIVAKVSRDREMATLDRHYPGYGFACHKGYPTKAHLEALRTLGVTEIHRRSFAPVKKLLE
jgi:ribonuclease HII